MKRPRKTDERKAEVIDEPWKERLAAGKTRNRGKQLVMSDEEEE